MALAYPSFKLKLKHFGTQKNKAHKHGGTKNPKTRRHAGT